MLLFDAVNDHFGASPERALQTLESVKEELSTFRDEAAAVGTRYAIEYFKRLADSLQDIAEKHFEESAASKPATLHVHAIDKKYPLHQSGELLELGFKVTNPGPGHALDVSLSLKETELESRGEVQHLLGQLHSGRTVDVAFDASVPNPLPEALCEVEVQWRNANGSASSSAVMFPLAAPRTDVDWGRWAAEDVYSLEPVETPDELIGRDSALRQLQRTVTVRSIGSTFISGQRRVGKTSLVKTLITDLLQRELGVHAVFVEAGDFLGPDATSTVAALGQVLYRRVRRLVPALAAMPEPTFDGTLSPLSRLLDDAVEYDSSLRCLFILDEFDMIPTELYESRNPHANALFQAIRSISGKRNFGFIIVGGENLRYVINGQGSALNKFETVELTYIDDDRSDFAALVKRPSDEYLEFSEEAMLHSGI